MAFIDRDGTNWDCLAAGLFLFLVALPALAGLGLSDCAAGYPDPNDCPDKRPTMLIWTGITTVACFAITWTVNWLIRKLRSR